METVYCTNMLHVNMRFNLNTLNDICTKNLEIIFDQEMFFNVHIKHHIVLIVL